MRESLVGRRTTDVSGDTEERLDFKGVTVGKPLRVYDSERK
jgi:hypothetical protein